MSFISGDFDYRESQHLEFKEAQTGLPLDLWETYSAFANTEGGEIVLGVREDAVTGEFVPVGVNEPGALIDEIWKIVYNKTKVERNILLPDDVRECRRDGFEFVVMAVPRGERGQKPVRVYSKKDKGFMAYVRCGSGDKEATGDSLKLMEYDSASMADRAALEEYEIGALCPETIQRYRNVFSGNKPSSPFNSDSNDDFLYHIGALNKGRDGSLRPTRAGLLAFGYEYEITRYLPAFLLDYREEGFDQKRWSDRIVSQSGDWSGNLVDFYFDVVGKLKRHFRQPFSTDDSGLNHTSNNPIVEAINEAVANAEVHAHYGNRATIQVILRPDELEIVNPGDFLIDRQVAIAGGFSESRNPTLMKMFGLIGATDRAGSGLQKIWATWNELFGESPLLEEGHQPASVKMQLSLRGRFAYGGKSFETESKGITAAEYADLHDVSKRVAQNLLKNKFDQGELIRKKVGREYRYFKKTDTP